MQPITTRGRDRGVDIDKMIDGLPLFQEPFAAPELFRVSDHGSGEWNLGGRGWEVTFIDQGRHHLVWESSTKRTAIHQVFPFGITFARRKPTQDRNVTTKRQHRRHAIERNNRHGFVPRTRPNGTTLVQPPVTRARLAEQTTSPPGET